jgi:hypothetical protein
VSDAAQVRAQLHRWAADLTPEAVGWLGSTAGITDDGTLVALARFESEEAARQNSDRASSRSCRAGRVTPTASVN